MGDQMRLTGAVSIIGPLIVYAGIELFDKYRKKLKLQFASEIIWKAELTLYTCVIIYMTIIRKLPLGTDHQLNLQLFWSYGRWKAADIRWQVYMNVFLFIPFGFFLRGKAIKTLLIAFVLASAIEVAQYIFCLGLCELDDIFHNTLGAMIGCGYYRVFDVFWKRTK